MARVIRHAGISCRGVVALEALGALLALVIATLLGLQVILLGVASTRLVVAERIAERSLAARGLLDDAIAEAALQLAPTCLAKPPGVEGFLDRFAAVVTNDMTTTSASGSLVAFARGQLQLLCALGHLELRLCRLPGEYPVYLVTLTYLYPLVVPLVGALFADGRDTVGRWLLGISRLVGFYGLDGDTFPQPALPWRSVVAVRRLVVRGWFSWDRPDAAPEANAC